MHVLHVSTYQLYDSLSPIVLKKKIVLSKENKLKDGKIYCPSLIFVEIEILDDTVTINLSHGITD